MSLASLSDRERRIWPAFFMRVARSTNETWRQARKASCADWMARSVSDHVIAGTSFNLVPVAGLMTGKLDLIARRGLSCMGGPSIYPLTLDLVDASMLPAVELTAAEFTLDAARNLRAPAVQLQPNLSFGFTAILTPNYAFQTIKANFQPRSQSRMFSWRR